MLLTVAVLPLALLQQIGHGRKLPVGSVGNCWEVFTVKCFKKFVGDRDDVSAPRAPHRSLNSDKTSSLTRGHSTEQHCNSLAVFGAVIDVQ